LIQAAAQIVVVAARGVWVEIDAIDLHSRGTEETPPSGHLVGGHLVLDDVGAMGNV
jgi:hypothetical protein